jgi:hypothetical protein
MIGKQRRSIPIENNNKIPKYIRQRILDLQPWEFGYSGWGMF